MSNPTATPTTPAAQTTSTPSFLQEIEQGALDEVNKIKGELVALWDYEEPIFVSELKSFGAALISIATGGLVNILSQVASGTIQKGESLGALITHTYQTAVGQGLQVTFSDAQAAASQAASAAVTVMQTGAPPTS